jgi:hypothetical protein
MEIEIKNERQKVQVILYSQYILIANKNKK